MPDMKLAAIFGFLAVLLGAFGAHALKDWLASLPDGADRLGWWKTGVEYQMFHALLLVGIAASGKPMRAATVLVAVGILLFSGSLYAMTLSGIRLLGAITPFGGLAFLGAWAMVFVAARGTSTAQT